MVVTRLPTAADIGTTHERTGLPSRCTVQAPHSDCPQPYFVPVRPRKSRMTHSRGMSGSTFTEWASPLTWSSCFTATGFRRSDALSCKNSAVRCYDPRHAAHDDHGAHGLLARPAGSAASRRGFVLLG